MSSSTGMFSTCQYEQDVSFLSMLQSLRGFGSFWIRPELIWGRPAPNVWQAVSFVQKQRAVLVYDAKYFGATESTLQTNLIVHHFVQIHLR